MMPSWMGKSQVIEPRCFLRVHGWHLVWNDRSFLVHFLNPTEFLYAQGIRPSPHVFWVLLRKPSLTSLDLPLPMVCLFMLCSPRTRHHPSHLFLLLIFRRGGGRGKPTLLRQVVALGTVGTLLILHSFLQLLATGRKATLDLLQDLENHKIFTRKGLGD